MRDSPEGNGASKRNSILVGNLGEPIAIADLNMAGVSAQAAQGGETIEIWTQLALTSDEALFQKIIGNLAATIEHAARSAGSYKPLDRAQTVLLILRPDNSGELWIDTAAMCTYSALRRPGPMAAGTVLFEDDIADVTGIWFPLVQVGPKDRILCIFREGWRFGLYFDFNPDGDLAIEVAKRALGSLYRKMRYADLYATLAHEPTFDGLVSVGWFPFLELMSGEFRTLSAAYEAGFELEEAEQALLAKFEEARLERMFQRWMARPHLKDKELILRPAINAFIAREPVSVIKNVLSEIEGVMAEAYFQSKGERTHRIEKLLTFVISLAEKRAGSKDTLFFPVEFGKYLKNYIYAGFSPGDLRGAGSRNAVGHGAVPADEYTMIRALQALLALDQLAFYT